MQPTTSSPLGYRAWLAQSPDMNWALNYVGNDYNNGKGGAGYNGSLDQLGLAAGAANNTGLSVAPVANDQYNRYSQIMDYANAYQNYLNGFTGSNNSLTASYDPATAGYYRDQANQLQGQIGNLDSQQNIGLQNIGNSYNMAANRLDQQKAVGQRNYDTATKQNTQNYLNTRNNILSNTRATSNALQRLLGMNGAGYSSAALEQAPYASALQGSQNLVQAQNTYGNNASGLDTNWQDTMRGYNNSMEDLNNQKYSQENSLKASIAQTRANLLDKIGQANSNSQLALGAGYGAAQAARQPYQNQINDLLSQIISLGQQYANPVMRTADVTYTTPDAAQYTLGRMAAPTNTSGGAQSDISPTFLSLLTGQKRDQFGNVIA